MSIIAGSGGSEQIFSGQRKDFVVMRKDTFEYTGQYTYYNSEGTRLTYDFTNCVGALQIRKKKTDTAVVKTVGVSFSGEDYTLSVSADDMDMDAGKYYYDLQIYDANSKMVTKLYGRFIVLQDVTDFSTPLDEEIDAMLKTAYDYLKGETFRESFRLQEGITYVKSTPERPVGLMKTEITYEKGRTERPGTMIMSNAILWQFVSTRLRTFNVMLTEFSYLKTEFVDVLYIMGTSYDYTLFQHG